MKFTKLVAIAVTLTTLTVACEDAGEPPGTSTQQPAATSVQPNAAPTIISPQTNPAITPTPPQITIAPPAQPQPSATFASSPTPTPPTIQPTSTSTPVRVGAGLPDFKLPVATGGEIMLSDYIGKKNVVLVFYRAWWCLYCRDQLIELRNHHREIMAQDAVVLAVSTDNLDGAKYAVETFAAPYAILYDVTTQVPRQYNVFNLHGDNLASASIFIIDKTGQLRFKEVGEVYTHQVSSAKIIAEIKKFQK